MALALEKGFLASMFEGFAINAARIIQHRIQNLHLAKFPGNNYPQIFNPVHLRHFARLERQRQIDFFWLLANGGHHLSNPAV